MHTVSTDSWSIDLTWTARTTSGLSDWTALDWTRTLAFAAASLCLTPVVRLEENPTS